MTTQSKCPITRAISRLKQFAGMPVPAIVKWISGKPDFRQVDMEKYVHHYRYKLCAICGTKLGLSCYWVGGPGCKESHYFIDGPTHRECAELSIRLCPYLNGARGHYRGDDLESMPIQNASNRPDKMYLLRGVTSAVELHQLGAESFGLYAGKQLTVVKEF